MSSRRKKQHYVWREYLRAWASKEFIWTFFIHGNKVEKPNLTGVGQENYFYELVDFTYEEKKYLLSFIEDVCHPSVKKIANDFLKLFTYHQGLAKMFKNTLGLDKEKIETEMRTLKINMAENSHTIFEGFGTRLIACRTVSDLSFLNDPKNQHDVIIFSCFQYFRTKKMKQSLDGLLEKKGAHHLLKFWNFVSHIMSLNVACSISLNPKLKFLIFENNTQINFLTCDQPIFNILKDGLDEKGNVKELELYYPLSPKAALLIHFRPQNYKIEGAFVSVDMVKIFNDKVVENADRFIFSDNAEQLEQLIKNRS